MRASFFRLLSSAACALAFVLAAQGAAPSAADAQRPPPSSSSRYRANPGVARPGSPAATRRATAYRAGLNASRARGALRRPGTEVAEGDSLEDGDSASRTRASAARRTTMLSRVRRAPESPSPEGSAPGFEGADGPGAPELGAPESSTTARASRFSMFRRASSPRTSGLRTRGPPTEEAFEADVSLHERASFVLGRELAAHESEAIERAHLVGNGELGRDGVNPAARGNYTQSHISQRARILRRAGLSRQQVRVLMETGVVGNPPSRQAQNAAHQAITTDLFNGEVIESRPFSKNNNRTQLFLIRVRNNANGRVRTALFKPRVWGDNEGWNRVPMEFVAYEINRMLDMDYIPPVAIRRNIGVEFQNWNEGALLHMVENPRSIRSVPENQWGVRRDLLLSDTRVLDVLLQNSDRHMDNFMIGTHWADGRQMPILIDQAAGLRPGASVNMDHDNAFGTGGVRVVRKATLDALRRLDFDTLRGRVGEFVSNGEIRGILARRDGIVAHFDRLIAQRGASNVVVDVRDF